MCNEKACPECICPKCFWYKTDECIEEENYCTDVCDGDYPVESCHSFENFE